MAEALPWNKWAVSLLKTHCYQNGEPPRADTLGCDLRWVKYRLTVQGDSRERLVMALQGAPMIWEALQTTKWSPAKVFNKRGTWVSLFERAITAAGKSRASRPETPPLFRQVFKKLAEQM